MTYVVVMPYRVEEWKQACLDTCRFDNLLLVDNTDVNLGIMRAHNLGIDYMREIDADWLIVMSAAVRFGAPGGLDYIDALDANTDWAVIPAQGVFGWHLIAFRRDTIEAAGRWDEHFTPYGYDDVDYSIRIHKALPDHREGGVPVDLTDAGMGHSLKLGGVKVENRKHLDYLKSKWGHEHGHDFPDYHDRPFGDPNNPVGYWPPINGAAWDQPAPKTAQAYVR
jgi:hypothetical protein